MGGEGRADAAAAVSQRRRGKRSEPVKMGKAYRRKVAGGQEGSKIAEEQENPEIYVLCKIAKLDRPPSSARPKEGTGDADYNHWVT